VMELLEGRVGEVVREYNAQDVANTLWAYATLGREPGGRLGGLLEEKAVCLAARYGCKDLSQLHQYLLSSSLTQASDVSPRPSLLELEKALGSACQDEFCKVQGHPSEDQQDVRRALCGMGLLVEEEARCPRSGYSIDMLAREPSPSADAHGESAACTARAAAEWAVEFDGPHHFLASRPGITSWPQGPSPTGATLLKRRHLQLLGYRLISVPYWEWHNVRGDTAAQETYLRSKFPPGHCLRFS
jgi:hypothetical protein